MQAHLGASFSDKNALEAFFDKHEITGKQTIKRLTESMLLSLIVIYPKTYMS